jgi:DNA-binding IclR family transcriptional regulator
MATLEKAVRQSVALPARTAKRVKALARSQQTTASRLLAELVEAGLESREEEKRRYLLLVEMMASASDPAVRRQMKEELARLTFGE